MTKRKVIWTFLAAGMTVISTGAASAQWVDHETLARMVSNTARRVAESPPVAPKAGPHGGNSLVGSWIETVTFPLDFPPNPGGVLKSLIAVHDDGTIEANDQGSVNLGEDMVTSAGVGVWTRLRNRKFAYTQLNLFSDLNGNLVGYLKVRGTYRLSPSGNEYEGESFAEVLDTAMEPVGMSVTVTNKGMRIPLELPPKE